MCPTLRGLHAGAFDKHNMMKEKEEMAAVFKTGE